jgi:hypothetical protein
MKEHDKHRTLSGEGFFGLVKIAVARMMNKMELWFCEATGEWVNPERTPFINLRDFEDELDIRREDLNQQEIKKWRKAALNTLKALISRHISKKKRLQLCLVKADQKVQCSLRIKKTT